MSNQSANKNGLSVSPRAVKTLVLDSINQILEILDTPVSLGIYIRLNSGDLSDLCEVRPSDYLERHKLNLPCGVSHCPPFSMDVNRFRLDAQALACVKKLSSDYIPSSVDLREKALQSFLEVERQCEQTNIVFRNRQFDYGTRSILERARQIVHTVLGDHWADEFTFTLKFGPGKTLSTTGSTPSHVIAKIGHGSSNTVTPRAVGVFHRAILADSELFRWACANGILHPITLRFCKNAFTERRAEKFSTVPKDFKKLRPIGVGMDLNLVLQLNVGQWILTKFNRFFKTSLRKVPAEHAALVELDSQVGAFATIDLSNASSTIATELVRFLLPQEWFELLAKIRSEFTLLPDGTEHFNEMFSAMGNGFTFELETLLFRALVQATLDHYQDPGLVSCYGDDIICPSHMATKVMHTLAVCGFTINREKTFTQAHRGFKESCGSDWFDGVNVRPVYFKEFSHDLKGLYSLCNRIAAVARIHYSSTGTSSDLPDGLSKAFDRITAVSSGIRDVELIDTGVSYELAVYDKSFIKPFRLVLAAIPLALRAGGPVYLGDSVIHGLRPKPKIRNSQVSIPVLRTRAHRVSYERLGSPELQLTYVRMGLDSEGVIPRNEPETHMLGRSFIVTTNDVEWW